MENKIRYCFTTYVRVRNSVAELTSQTSGLSSDSKSDSGNFEIQNFSFLPKTVFEKHEEYLYLGLVENIISNGVTKNDRTRTGTVSIFGCQVTSLQINIFYLFLMQQCFMKIIL